MKRRTERTGQPPGGRRESGRPALLHRPVPAILVPGHVRLLVLLAYAVIAAAIVVDLVTGPGSTFSPLLAAVPVLASATTRRAWVPLVAGGIAVLAVGVLGLLNPGVPAAVHLTAAVTVLAVTFTSAATVLLVASRERELATARTVSEATQRALLRPPPARVAGLRVAVRYAAAGSQARIGGDLYEVVNTPWGARVLLGDVRGKGLAAVETVADVLGVFRDAARSEPDLGSVAVRLDTALARKPCDERSFVAEFVTAVLVGFAGPDEPASVVNCGHPPPLLRRAGRVTEVLPPRYFPPLALLGMVGGRYPVGTVALERGDELLLYTDGVSEARDAAGRFYPLADRFAVLPGGDPDVLLDALLADVRRYAGGGLDDDAAVLAVLRED